MTITRRSIIGLGTAAVAASALGACSPGGTGPGTPNATAAATAVLPAMVPFGGVKPDLAANPATGVPEGFLAYPGNPARTWPASPGDGSRISVMKQVVGASPVPLDRNPFQQDLNARLGADVDITHVVSSEYSAKRSVVIASGDLPDLMQVDLGMPDFLQLARAKFQDLSEFIGGDRVKDYPGLASLPTVSWSNVAPGGGLWGVPFPLGVVAADNKVRKDIIDQLGLSTELRDGKEFVDLCTAVAASGTNRFAFSRLSHVTRLVSEMVGVPNNFRVANGAFTAHYDTDEYVRMLEIAHDLWVRKAIHPEAATGTLNFQQEFASGRSLFLVDGYTNWSTIQTLGSKASPGFDLDGFVPPRWSGGGVAPHWQGPGIASFTAVKKGDPDRTRMLLRILDWMAAPFGTDEYRFRRWGREGADFTLKGTDPISTETGTQLVLPMQLSYIASGANPLYVPGSPDLVGRQHDYLGKLMVGSVPDPTVGLYAPTRYTAGATITKQITAHETDIIVGRKPVSSWTDAVKAWKSGGGDMICDELGKALAAR